MSPFPIRPRTGADVAGVADLLLATHHSDQYPIVLPPDLPAWAAADDVVAGWVAVDPSDDVVVGHVVLTEVDEGPATAQWVAHTGVGPEALIVVRRLVVHQRAHRTGTGRALLRTALAEARRLGRWPVLDMADNLHAAAALYADEGFTTIGAYDLDLLGHPLHVLTLVGPRPSPGVRGRGRSPGAGCSR